jgi:hypothetical protein
MGHIVVTVTSGIVGLGVLGLMIWKLKGNCTP